MKVISRIAIAISILSLALPLSAIQPASAVSANPTPNCSAGSTCTITFTYTGDYYAWNVPSSVSSFTFDVQGAQGGTTTSAGGLGGRVTGTLAVTPSSTLYFYVGGAGAVSAAGGWNGGGDATGITHGGSGGGGSDIRTVIGDWNSRIVVAGGGGGASGGSYAGVGGAGGGLTGGDGPTSGSYSGGKGGTQSAGGAGGTGYCSPAVNGAFGVGGGSTAYHCPGGGGGWYGGGRGAVMGGGGGSSYTSATLATGVTHTQGAKNGNGQISITYVNAPTPTTFSTSQSTPTNISASSTISYSLVLSQSVSDLAAGDFQLGGSATCNTPGLSGSGTTYTVTLTNCSEGSVILQLKANSVTGTSTGPASISSANTVEIDRTAPTISSVTAPGNATYKPSDTPTFLVNFSESVTVTGSPRLVLTVGAAAEYAIYHSMIDSRTARFRYTVATDPLEFDTDGISINTTLDLNSGAIADLSTNAIADRTFTAPTLTSVLVAQPAAAPTIDSITATNAQLTIYFTAGAARGSTTSSYQYSANNGAWTNRPTGTTASPITLAGLTNGTGYTIRLRAVTNAGNSDSSTAVTETPTAISVTGDTTLVLTYGNSGSTSSYSATGGTGTYTWSLGSVISGITLSGTTVSAANTLTAGTYSQTVRATDGNSQVGTKSLTITINKASSSISIALPNSANSAALGGAVTITATVPRAGSVNFKLGGSTISGCASSSAASTTATCSWTPGSLGSVSLTAVFTPTDSSNYETSTSTTLSITVVNGVSTVVLQLTGGVTEVPKGQAINIIAAIDQAGKVSFYVDGKRLPGCFNKSFSAGNAACAWKPATQKQVSIRATLDPTNNVYNNSSSTLNIWVKRRVGLR